MHKLLITNTSEDFCNAVAELLDEVFDIRLCCEGNRALELIKSFRPDVVCLDMTLSGLDGLSILESVLSSGLNPTVLVISDYLSEYVIHNLNRMGVSFVMRKPCAVSAVASRLVDIQAQRKQIIKNPLAEKDPMESILVSLGIRFKGKNHACLKEALRIYMQDPGQAITKELYPAVASVCGGNANQVEKAIRDAIKTAWQYRDNVFWQRFFPEYCKAEKCPSNGKFIDSISSLLFANDTMLVFPSNVAVCSCTEITEEDQLEAAISL